MTLLTKTPNTKPVIDLHGPDGNAFVLLAYVKTFGTQMGMTRNEIQTVQNKMQEHDYAHLVQTFEEHFGEVVDLVVPEGVMADINAKKSKEPKASKLKKSSRKPK